MKNKGIVWNGFFFSEQFTDFCGQYSENVYSEKKTGTLVIRATVSFARSTVLYEIN